MTEREIFVAALEIKDRAARRAYVLQACGAEDALRQRVEALLENHDQAGSFLESPPSEVAPTAYREMQERTGSRMGPYKLLQELASRSPGIAIRRTSRRGNAWNCSFQFARQCSTPIRKESSTATSSPRTS